VLVRNIDQLQVTIHSINFNINLFCLAITFPQSHLPTIDCVLCSLFNSAIRDDLAACFKVKLGDDNLPAGKKKQFSRCWSWRRFALCECSSALVLHVSCYSCKLRINRLIATLKPQCNGPSVYNFSSFLSHSTNSNLTVTLSSFLVLSSTYSIMLCDRHCFYCSLCVISYSAIFAASVSLNVQFSSSYSNTVTDTLAVDGWAVTFGTA